MCPLFKREKQEYPTESKWSVIQGIYQEHPILVRRNDSAKVLIGSHDYIYRLGFAIRLGNPDESGLPPNDEANILNQIEDELCAQFEKNQIAIEVLAISTNGMREFVFYSRDIQNVEQVFNKIRTSFTSHDIQSYHTEDKDCDLYKEFEQT